MTLQECIATFLSGRPATKAGEIAAAIGVDKADVNRVLYAGKGRSFELNQNFQWSVNGRVETVLASAQHDNHTSESIVAPVNGCSVARATLARLKRGVPPDRAVDDLMIGMDHLLTRLRELLEPKSIARWLAVTGEYGDGKTFFRAVACDQALTAGFAVASFDVNRDDGALHQPQRHLAVLLNTLRSPLPSLQHHQGIVDIFRHWLAVTPRQTVIATLNRLRNVSPPINNVRDTAEFGFLIQQAASMPAAGQFDLQNSPHLIRLAILMSCIDLIGRSSP